jgi:hypothetical protein
MCTENHPEVYLMASLGAAHHQRSIVVEDAPSRGRKRRAALDAEQWEEPQR